jgi:hypothetical protein
MWSIHFEQQPQVGLLYVVTAGRSAGGRCARIGAVKHRTSAAPTTVESLTKPPYLLPVVQFIPLL